MGIEVPLGAHWQVDLAADADGTLVGGDCRIFGRGILGGINVSGSLRSRPAVLGWNFIFPRCWVLGARHGSMELSTLKWGGTILCLIGIALTSFNIYPVNIVISLIGSALWTVAGFLQKDTPLFLVEVVAVGIYLSGLIAWL